MDRRDTDRRDTDQREADRRKREADRRDAERRDTERRETERRETERRDTERKETERREAERKETERRETERKETERKETERREAERRETERKEKERKEKERKEKERRDAERRETERREAERRETERREADRRETERRELDRRDTDRRDMDRRERESRSERMEHLPKRQWRTPSPPPSVKQPPPSRERPRSAAPPLPPLPEILSPTLPRILEDALEQPLPPLSPTLPPVLEEALRANSPKASRNMNREGSVDSCITVRISRAAPPTPPKKTVSSSTKKNAASKTTASPTNALSPYLKVPCEPKKQLSLAKEAVTKSASVPVGKVKLREVSLTPTKRALSPAVSAKVRSVAQEDLPDDDYESGSEPRLSRVIILRFRQKKRYYEQFVKLIKPPKEKIAGPEKRPVPEVAGKSTGKRLREAAEEREKTPVPKKQRTADTPTVSDKGDKERERGKNAALKASTPSKGTGTGHTPPDRGLAPPPKKEKAITEKAAIPRTESRDGQIRAGKDRTATPMGIKQEAKLGIEVRNSEGRARKVSHSQPPLQLDPTMSAKAEAFSAEHMKYQDLGKRLKHEAEGKIHSDRVAKDERYPKLLLLDSVL